MIFSKYSTACLFLLITNIKACGQKFSYIDPIEDNGNDTKLKDGVSLMLLHDHDEKGNVMVTKMGDHDIMIMLERGRLIPYCLCRNSREMFAG